MGLKKYAAKIDDYFERLKEGKAEKIKKSHVDKVIHKLQAKKLQLAEEIKETSKESKIARLERKVLVADEHLKRAEVLLANLKEPTEKSATPPESEAEQDA